MTSDLHLISFNARGLRQPKKRRQLFSFLHNRKADIILLQETHTCVNDETQWTQEWGNSILFSHGSTNSRGVAIMFKPHSPCTIGKVTTHPFGRYIIVDLTIYNKVFTLIVFMDLIKIA